MNSKTMRMICAACALGLLIGTADAGPLPSDTAALASAQGSTLFTGSAGSFTLKAEVEYAVYAPGHFGASTALGLPAIADPSGGTQYVYAYEILNDANGSNVVAMNLSVALVNGAAITSSLNVGDVPGTPEGGWPTQLDQFIPTSSNPKTNVKWTYTTNFPTPGQHSDILIFTSPYGPERLNAAMQGGHATIASGMLPSPTPEPSTLLMMGTAAVLLAAAKVWRGRRSSSEAHSCN